MDNNSDLTYNIASQRLYGIVDNETIDAIAYSGGRGGTKIPHAHNGIIMNNPFLTGVKLDENNKNSMGGPLPMGYYILQPHEYKINWIRLNPCSGNFMNKRNGFAIHGRGQRGSDGCIVPKDFSIVQKLYKISKEKLIGNKAPLLLRVYAVGDMDYFEKLINYNNAIG
jgi:hypothetical protein